MRPAVIVASVLTAACLALTGCASAATTPDGSSTAPAASSAAPAAGAAISIYYPVAVGNTWVYSIDYGNGMVVTDTEVMTKVTPEGGGTRATIERTFTWNDKSQPELMDSVEYVFGSDGSLTVPFQSLPIAGGGTVTVKSGELVWPTSAEFEAGTAKTGIIEASIDSNGTTTEQTVKFTITGSGVESVTVPAGTFSARKLLQNLLISLPSLGVTDLPIDSVSWLAEDVGAVRTEIPDQSGGPTIVQQLLSFTPRR